MLNKQYYVEKAKVEKLIARKNQKTDFYNGIYDRYEYPVLTREFAPVEWRYDLNPKTNPNFQERLGINAVMNSGAIELNGKYYLVVRVEGNDRKSFFAVAESDTGIDGGIGFGLCDDIEHAVIDEEKIISKRIYHTLTESKNGAGAVPIRGKKCWINIAHGVRNTAAGLRYVLYVFGTDLNDPSKVIAEPSGVFLVPLGKERVGDVSNVVFTNGAIAKDNGDVYIYYASCDTRMHVATTTIDKLEDYRDIESINFFTELTEAGLMTPEYMMKCLMLRSRDNARTPMQWDDSAQAGFTDGESWIKVNPNYKEINAAQQLEDPNSIFHYYQKLIRLRKEKDVIVYGEFEPIYRDDEQIFAYIRRQKQEKLLTVCNFSDKNAEMEIPEEFKGAECLITNLDRTVFEGRIVLKPYEAFVLYKK